MKAKLAYDNGFVIAHVEYEGELFRYTFGRNCPKGYIWQTLPKLVTDELFDRKIRERAVA